jgi:hypothetical protein
LDAEWPVIAGAPTLILIVVGAAMIIAWGLRGSVSRFRIGALEERLRAAAEKFETAAAEKAQLEKAFGRLEREIFEVGDAKARISLSAMSAAMRAHMERFNQLWIQCGSSIGRTGRVTRGGSPAKDQNKK